MTHYWTEHAEPGGTSCEAATTTGAAKVAAGIDCLDGGADIVKRDNDDDVIDDDHDTIIFDTSAAFASASNWPDEARGTRGSQKSIATCYASTRANS